MITFESNSKIVLMSVNRNQICIAKIKCPRFLGTRGIWMKIKCMWSVFLMQSVSDGVVLLKGKAGNTEKPVEFSISVDSTRNISPVDAALPIHRLAAKAQIKQLEDGEKGQLLFANSNAENHHRGRVKV